MAMVTMVMATALLVLGLTSCTGGPEASAPTSETTRTLSLALDGAGSIRAASATTVVTCTDACDVAFPRGASVDLTATPAPGLGFAGWGEACTGVDDCKVNMEGDRSVSARFRVHVLTLTLDGDAAVKAVITPGPDGLDSLSCERRCATWYDARVSVSINLEDIESGSQVGAWTGCPDGSSPTFCYLELDGPATIEKVVVHPPTAAADSATTPEDTPLSVAPPGVLENDSDSPGDPLRASLDPTRSASHGTLVLRGDGSFTYLPDADYGGPDSFGYWAWDAIGNRSEPATVQLEVAPRNDPPTVTIAADPPTVKDGAGPQRIPAFATNLGPGGGPDEAGQQLRFSLTVESTTGTLAFDEPPAIDPDGILHYAATPGTHGTATAMAVLEDDGGTADGGVDASAPQAFAITVRPLLLSVVVNGDGAVTVAPDGGEYALGTAVVITALTDREHKLKSWGGACTGTSTKSKSCTVTMVADTYVSVNYGPVQALTVGIGGGGEGRVTSVPPGIDCATSGTGNCEAQFLKAETVTLSAAAAVGSAFTSWTNCLPADTATCQVLLDEDRSVGATFDPGP